MRALRDFNTPKIVTDDVQIFMGLIGDLFPALNVPRKRDLDFEQTVKQSVLVRTYKPTCTFTVPSNYFLHCFCAGSWPTARGWFHTKDCAAGRATSREALYICHW